MLCAFMPSESDFSPFARPYGQSLPLRLRSRPGIIIDDGASGAALHTGWIAIAQITDEGQARTRMQGRHAKGTSIYTGRAAYALLADQKDSPRQTICV